MQTQTGTQTQPRPTSLPRPDAASPFEIEAVLERLANYIKTDTEADMLALWATSTLASKLGITTALSASSDPVEVVRDLGDAFAEALATGLDDHPAQTAQVLRAAMKVIEQMAADAKARGLAG